MGPGLGSSFPAGPSELVKELHQGRKDSGVQEPEANTQIASGEVDGVQCPAFVGKQWLLNGETTAGGTDWLVSLHPYFILAT